MRVLIATIGSAGDVHPYLAIAAALRDRGHEALVMTNPYFESRVKAAGAEFVALGTTEQYLEAIRDPRLIHPTRGPAFVIGEFVAKTAREHMDLTRRVIREWKPHAGLRHLISFGPAWALEAEGVPLAVGAVAPMLWFSRHDPAVYRGWGPTRTPGWLHRAQLWAGRWQTRLIYDGPLNAARRECGLAPVRHALISGMTGSGVRLGLWSGVMRGPMPDDPEGSVICGCCARDEHPDHAQTGPLERFLECGPPPVVFTLGSSVVHQAGRFYEHAARAARALGVRAVLLVGPSYAGNAAPPGADGPGVHVAAYAPFTWLFARCLAVVHHGGAGTTGAALAAGIPQVILPFANDEFDNAARIERLGVGVRLGVRGLSAAGLERALSRALQPWVRARAGAMGAKARRQDGPAGAVRVLEGMAGGARESGDS